MPEDTEAALEWLRLERLRCSGCGHPRDETMSPDGPHYDAEALRCRACEARDAARRDFLDGGGTSDGLYVSVHEQED